MRNSFFRYGLFGVVGLFLLWLAGFFFFVASLPEQADYADEKVEGIVVLTGGTKRLDTGFQLLKDGRGYGMLVTGVGKGATFSELFDYDRDTLDRYADRVQLGYVASDTASNAAEARVWLQLHEYKSAYLVTAHYHVPRALHEFEALMPDTMFYVYPVFPEHVRVSSWWQNPGTALLLISEYHKFLAVVVGHFFY